MSQEVSQSLDLNLAEWLYKLEHRYQQEIRLGLKRIKQVAEQLDLYSQQLGFRQACNAAENSTAQSILHPQATVITVAGTNGKGTTVAALNALYRAAGYRVGVYTSPHLLHFNERIQVDGECIADEALCRAFATIEKCRGEIELSYFETVTLAALLYFHTANLDVMILEVGLGGRFDAVNILDADLSIITTIDFDHQAYLGTTLEHIGFEKAGILRHHQPVIYADKTPPQSILNAVRLLNCPFYVNGQDYHYECFEHSSTFQFESHHLVLPRFPWHPHAIAAALMAIHCLQTTRPVSLAAQETGLLAMILNGRQQYLKTSPQTLIDVAHNAQSVAYLAKMLKQQSNRRIHAVFSALGDKDLDALIHPMQALVTAWYPSQLEGKRAASKDQLQQILIKYDIIGVEFYDSVVKAYQAACQHAAGDDLIVVYGSFLTVSEVLRNVAE